MQFESAFISSEFERWSAKLPEEDPYVSAKTLGIRDVIRAHFLIIDFFATSADLEGVGGIGPKNLDLLHSALYRQHIGFGSTRKFSSDFEIIATLMYGLIKNHPFHDANKRTAFLTALFHLDYIKRMPTADQKIFEDLTVAIAEADLEKYPRYDRIASENDEPEVAFIADFLRRNSRPIDKRHHDVTYQQLNTILGRYNCALENPRHNQIDVVRYETRRTFLGLGKEVTNAVRITNIGFPNWKSQVPKQTISKVREELGLIPRKGHDSKSFYDGADPLPTLVSRYQRALQRLADR